MERLSLIQQIVASFDGIVICVILHNIINGWPDIKAELNCEKKGEIKDA